MPNQRQAVHRQLLHRPQRKRRDQHAEHEQRHAEAAVPERALHRRGEEASHHQRLNRQQRRHARGVQRLPPVDQQRDDSPLRQRHRPARHLRRALRPQAHRQRADAHARVAADRLEVVQRHDAVRAGAVERRQDQRAQARRAAGHDRGAGDPRQALITKPAGRVAPPTVLLQAQRRRAVGPGEQQPESGGSEDPRPDGECSNERQQRPRDRHVQAPAPGHAARRNRPLRFVDGIDLAVEPVVDGLAGRADQRPRQQHARGHQPQPPVGRRARGDRAAGKGPHRREPGDRLEQFSDCGGRGQRHQCMLRLTPLNVN